MMRINKMKPTVTKLIFIVISSLVIGCFVLWFLNYYVGYLGYNKHKYRRFSKTLSESKSRNTFIKELRFETQKFKINSVFIEKAYRYGYNYSSTKLLTKYDKFEDNNTDSLYQLIIAFDKIQNNNEIFVPQNITYLMNPNIEDTIFLSAYVHEKTKFTSSKVTFIIFP